MESSTIITIITALAALVGATSPIIVALIQSTKEKQRSDKGILLPSNVILHRPKTQVQWTAVFIFAILGGFIGFGGAKLANITPPNIIPSITATSTKVSATAKTPTVYLQQNTPTAFSVTPKTISGELVFSESFDSGTTKQFSPFPNGAFYVTKDETGNFVYEIANFSKSEFPCSDFGSTAWKNYAIEYKVRFLEYKGHDAQASVYFRNAYRGGAGYHLDIAPTLRETRLAYWSGSEWLGIVSEEYKIEKNVWYSNRIEVQDNEIKFFINEKLVIFAIDKRRQSGQVALMAGPGANVQFDDIRVTLFDK